MPNLVLICTHIFCGIKPVIRQCRVQILFKLFTFDKINCVAARDLTFTFDSLIAPGRDCFSVSSTFFNVCPNDVVFFKVRKVDTKYEAFSKREFILMKECHQLLNLTLNAVTSILSVSRMFKNLFRSLFGPMDSFSEIHANSLLTISSFS